MSTHEIKYNELMLTALEQLKHRLRIADYFTVFREFEPSPYPTLANPVLGDGHLVLNGISDEKYSIIYGIKASNKNANEIKEAMRYLVNERGLFPELIRQHRDDIDRLEVILSGKKENLHIMFRIELYLSYLLVKMNEREKNDEVFRYLSDIDMKIAAAYIAFPNSGEETIKIGTTKMNLLHYAEMNDSIRSRSLVLHSGVHLVDKERFFIVSQIQDLVSYIIGTEYKTVVDDLGLTSEEMLNSF